MKGKVKSLEKVPAPRWFDILSLIVMPTAIFNVFRIESHVEEN